MVEIELLSNCVNKEAGFSLRQPWKDLIDDLKEEKKSFRHFLLLQCVFKNVPYPWIHTHLAHHDNTVACVLEGAILTLRPHGCGY